MVAFFSAVTLLAGSLHGTVLRGPISPVCRIGTPCTAPAKNVTLYFTRDGRTLTAKTDARGRYRLRLTAGVYAVKTDQRRFGVRPQPRSVTVRGGLDRRVNFTIDTGIR